MKTNDKLQNKKGLKKTGFLILLLLVGMGILSLSDTFSSDTGVSKDYDLAQGAEVDNTSKAGEADAYSNTEEAADVDGGLEMEETSSVLVVDQVTPLISDTAEYGLTAFSFQPESLPTLTMPSIKLPDLIKVETKPNLVMTELPTLNISSKRKGGGSRNSTPKETTPAPIEPEPETPEPEEPTEPETPEPEAVAPTIVMFSASPTEIESGESVTLSWEVKDAEFIEISGFGEVTATDTELVVAPTETTAYTLTVKNSQGEVDKTIVVVVNITEPEPEEPTEPETPEPEVPVATNPFVRGGVSLTFDDATISQYLNAAPIFVGTEHKPTLYVSTNKIGTSDFMTWDQVKEMRDNGWEIGGHAYDHEELPELPEGEVGVVVAQSLVDFEEQGIDATEFATPYGAYDKLVLAEIAKSYNSHRGFHDLALNKWPFNRYLLHVNQVEKTTTLEEIKGWLDEAADKDYWLIMVFHDIFPQSDIEDGDEWSWTAENLISLSVELESRGIAARTISDMLAVENIIDNGTFAEGMTGWDNRGSDFVTLDTDSNGSYPDAKNSVKFMSGFETKSVYLFSEMIEVEHSTDYGVRFFVNTNNLTAGDFGFIIDEYDADGNWLRYIPLGKAGVGSSGFTVDESYLYTSSADVASVEVYVFLEENPSGYAFVDSIEFFKAPKK